MDEGLDHSVGERLLDALVSELRNADSLPPWNRMLEADQNKIIDRLRARVKAEVMLAIKEIEQGPGVGAAAVEIASVNKTKSGAKATIRMDDDATHWALDRVGQQAILVIVDPDVYFERMEEIRGESDQRNLILDGKDPF